MSTDRTPLATALHGADRSLVQVATHRLVLEAFVGPCPVGMEAAHGNGVRADNRLSNLRWATRVDNHADKSAHGTAQRGERANGARLTIAKVAEIRRRRSRGELLVALGRAFGVHLSTIQLVCVGKTWKDAKETECATVRVLS